MNGNEPITLVSPDIPENYHWSLGDILPVEEWSVGAVNQAMTHQQKKPGCTLFWDFEWGHPPTALLSELQQEQRHLWHGGLQTSAGLYDPLVRLARPCWMLHLRLPVDTKGISWRVDFRCVLVRNSILNDLGGLHQAFKSLAVAGLEFGYRALLSGGFPVYVPNLIPDHPGQDPDTKTAIPQQDHILFARLHLTRFWAFWAIFRGVIRKEVGMAAGFYGMLKRRAQQKHTVERQGAGCDASQHKSVSVIIITLGRYRYIQTVLDALLQQTVVPQQIIIVDATPEKDRVAFPKTAPPAGTDIQWIFADFAGQCSQRNTGIRHATGEFVLFLDDDMDEIPTDHLERHLKNLYTWEAEASCGTPDESGALPVQRDQMTLRVSDVFPTCDVMVRRSALEKSGFFDEKMDQGMSEDHELGTRLYLSGALILLDPDLRTLHLRASEGGLRTHRSRVMTYSTSRTRLLHRRLPHITELYLMLKFFPKDEVRESQLLSLLGTFSIRGAWYRKILKAIISIVLLPNTFASLRKRTKWAIRMHRDSMHYPQIKAL